MSRTSELRVNQLSEFLGRAIKLKPENGRTRSEPSKEVSLKLLNPKVQAVRHRDSPYPEHPVLSLTISMPSLSQCSQPCFLPFYLLYLGLYHVGQKAQKRLVTLWTLHFLFLLFPFKGYCKSPKQKAEKKHGGVVEYPSSPEFRIQCSLCKTHQHLPTPCSQRSWHSRNCLRE